MINRCGEERISYLDGLRSVAILAVALFHYYYAFPRVAEVSYGTSFGGVFRAGFLGVMLFFSISGFVIVNSLSTSAGLKVFFIKRFCRLFPAMFFCSILTYFISFFPPFTYRASFYNFIPSMTFVEPRVFNYILGVDRFDWMDGAYWSLFTEVRFYLIISLFYFLCGNGFLRNFAIFSLSVGIFFPLAILMRIDVLRGALGYVFVANQLPWFVLGVGFYCLHINKRKMAFSYMGIALLSLSLFAYAIKERPYLELDPELVVVGAFWIFFLLYAAESFFWIRRLLTFRPFVMIGVASYGLYLIHQQVGEKLIVVVDSFLISSGMVFLSSGVPIFVLFILISFSLALHRYYDGPVVRRLGLFFKSALSK